MSSLSIELESKSAGDCSTAASRNAVHDQAHAPSSQYLTLFFVSWALLLLCFPPHELAVDSATLARLPRRSMSVVVCLLSHWLVLSSFRSAA
jgi:hypothetical protein